MGEDKPSVPELLDKLRAALRDRPAQFARVGGEVALVIVGHEPAEHTIRVNKRGVVELVAEKAVAPIVTVGIKPSALRWMLEGTLDVEAAFQKRRLAVEGDASALARFAQCFMPNQSMIGIRKKD